MRRKPCARCEQLERELETVRAELDAMRTVALGGAVRIGLLRQELAAIEEHARSELQAAESKVGEAVHLGLNAHDRSTRAEAEAAMLAALAMADELAGLEQGE